MQAHQHYQVYPSNDELPPAVHIYDQQITKGQGLKIRSLVRQRAFKRNLQQFGNAHKEVDRKVPPAEVFALVERRIPNDHDRLAPDTLQTREEKTTFQEFCGLSREAEFEPCLTGIGDHARLAFREKDRPDSAGGLALLAAGKKRRVKDGEKWPVSER